MKKLLVLGMAIALASAVYAFPTLLGPTGGVAVPDCAVATGLSATVAALGSGAGASIPQTFVQYGVMENLEVGAGYADAGVVNGTAWSLNAKYILPVDLAGIKLAVGAVYGNGKNGAGKTINPINAYLSGTYGLAKDVNVVGSAMYSDPDTAGKSNQVSGAIAIEQAFDNGKIGAEIAMKDFGVVGAKAGLNLYATMAVNDAISARAAIAGINTGASTFDLSLMYAFGGK